MLYTVHKDEKFDEHRPKQTENSKTHEDASPSIVMKDQTSHTACEQVPEPDGEKHVKNPSIIHRKPSRIRQEVIENRQESVKKSSKTVKNPSRSH